MVYAVNIQVAIAHGHETFVSIRAAQHEYNVTTITKCLNGKCKTAGNLNGMKLHWVYKS